MSKINECLIYSYIILHSSKSPAVFEGFSGNIHIGFEMMIMFVSMEKNRHSFHKIKEFSGNRTEYRKGH